MAAKTPKTSKKPTASSENNNPTTAIKTGMEKDRRGRLPKRSMPKQMETTHLIKGARRTIQFLKDKSTPVGTFVLEKDGIIWRPARKRKKKKVDGGESKQQQQPAQPVVKPLRKLSQYRLVSWPDVDGQEGAGRWTEQPQTLRLIPDMIYELTILAPNLRPLGVLMVTTEAVKYLKPKPTDEEMKLPFTAWDELHDALISRMMFPTS